MEMKDRIRQIMDDAKMSQQDFAAKLEISAASLSSIFTGRTRPTNNHVQNTSSPQPELGLLFSEPPVEQPLPQERSPYPIRSKIEQNREVNIIDKRIRKVREIRVFYDDGTYETFTPSSK